VRKLLYFRRHLYVGTATGDGIDLASGGPGIRVWGVRQHVPAAAGRSQHAASGKENPPGHNAWARGLNGFFSCAIPTLVGSGHNEQACFGIPVGRALHQMAQRLREG